MATSATEGKYAGEYLVWEADQDFSRDKVTIVSGQNLQAGAVVGKITATGKYAAYDNGASDGTQTAVAVLFDNTDASAGDVVAVAHTRVAVVNKSELVWGSGQSGSDQTAGLADLLAVLIVAR